MSAYSVSLKWKQVSRRGNFPTLGLGTNLSTNLKSKLRTSLTNIERDGIFQMSHARIAMDTIG